MRYHDTVTANQGAYYCTIGRDKKILRQLGGGPKALKDLDVIFPKSDMCCESHSRDYSSWRTFVEENIARIPMVSSLCAMDTNSGMAAEENGRPVARAVESTPSELTEVCECRCL